MLNQREKVVLASIITQFIKTAEPVGSKTLSFQLNLGLSPATIRNIMAQLEEQGYITQPHTSAGRVPTSLGYREYVSHLMKRKRLSREEKELIYHSLKMGVTDFNSFLETASMLLANITHQLSFLTIPVLENSVLKKLDADLVGNNRLMIVIYVDSGILHSVYLEINDEVKYRDIDRVISALNERLQGMKLTDIMEKFRLLIQDMPVHDEPVLRVILKNYQTVFNPVRFHDLIVKGTSHLVVQPEFQNNPRLADLLRIIEKKEPFLQLFYKEPLAGTKSGVAIGEEIPVEELQDCAIITSEFSFGKESGKIGILGPKRMNYEQAFSLIEFTAKVISDITFSN